MQVEMKRMVVSKKDKDAVRCISAFKMQCYENAMSRESYTKKSAFHLLPFLCLFISLDLKQVMHRFWGLGCCCCTSRRISREAFFLNLSRCPKLVPLPTRIRWSFQWLSLAKRLLCKTLAASFSSSSPLSTIKFYIWNGWSLFLSLQPLKVQ